MLAAAALHGQGSISGPVSEYVFDPSTSTIRAIVGAPGSAYVSKSVTAGIQFGSVAPNGVSAITVAGDSSNFIATLTQSPLITIPLPGAIDGADQILWSLDSSAAVLFSSRGRSLQFVSQFNQQPVVQSKIDLSTLEPVTKVARGRVTAAPIVLLATDSAAKMAVIAIGGQVYLIQNGASPQLLLKLESAKAAAFSADGSVYIVDGTANQVWAVRNPSGSPQVQSLSATPADLGDPVGIAVQGSQFYVARSADNRIRVYNLTTLQQTGELPLDAAASTLQPFTATSFLANARRDPADPVLLLQTAPTPSVIFIPTGANQ